MDSFLTSPNPHDVLAHALPSTPAPTDRAAYTSEDSVSSIRSVAPSSSPDGGVESTPTPNGLKRSQAALEPLSEEDAIARVKSKLSGDYGISEDLLTVLMIGRR